MRMKKLMAAILACSMLASMAACSSEEEKPEEKPAENTPAASEEAKPEEEKKDDKEEATAELPSIGVTIYKYDDNFMTYTRSAMETAAEGIAVLSLNDSGNDQVKQNDQIDTLIQKKVGALIVNLVDPSNAPTVAEKAKAADIPVVFVNKEYPEGTDKIDYDKCIYVGTRSEESGIIQGELIRDAWNENKEAWDKNGDGKIQYVMLMGEVGHPDAEARTKYSISTLNDNGIETEELGNQSATWDTAKAKELMETWLGKFGDKIEMVICNNDGMAMGAIEALSGNGYFGEDGKYMPVFGVDALPEALDLIMAGKMAGTVLNDPLNQGKACVEIAVNYAAGKDPLEGTNWKADETKAVRVPYQPITEANIDVAKEAYGIK